MIMNLAQNPLFWVFVLIFTLRNLSEFQLSRKSALRSARLQAGIVSLVLFYVSYVGISGGVMWAMMHGQGNWAVLLSAGALLLGLHGIRRWLVGSVLGESYNQLTRPLPTAMLRTTGPYRWIRHPIYVLNIFEMLALASLCPNGFSYVMVLFDMVVTLARIPGEERLLVQHYGRAYIEYRNKTARILPGVW